MDVKTIQVEEKKRLETQKKEWEAKGYDLLWEDLESFLDQAIQRTMEKAYREGQRDAMNGINPHQFQSLEKKIKRMLDKALQRVVDQIINESYERISKNKGFSCHEQLCDILHDLGLTHSPKEDK